MKLFALSIDFNHMDWIIGGEAKIRIVIREHIFLFFSFLPEFHKNPTTNLKIHLRPTSEQNSKFRTIKTKRSTKFTISINQMPDLWDSAKSFQDN